MQLYGTKIPREIIGYKLRTIKYKRCNSSHTKKIVCIQGLLINVAKSVSYDVRLFEKNIKAFDVKNFVSRKHVLHNLQLF